MEGIHREQAQRAVLMNKINDRLINTWFLWLWLDDLMMLQNYFARADTLYQVIYLVNLVPVPVQLQDRQLSIALPPFPYNIIKFQ